MTEQVIKSFFMYFLRRCHTPSITLMNCEKKTVSFHQRKTSSFELVIASINYSIEFIMKLAHLAVMYILNT